jgi:hypothetical protein
MVVVFPLAKGVLIQEAKTFIVSAVPSVNNNLGEDGQGSSLFLIKADFYNLFHDDVDRISLRPSV